MSEIGIFVLGLFWKAGVYKKGIEWFGDDESQRRATWNALIWVAIGFSLLGGVIRFLNYIPLLAPATALVYLVAYIGVFSSYFRIDPPKLVPFALVNLAGGLAFELIRWLILAVM